MPVETKPPQVQNEQPGHEAKMHPEPDFGLQSYRGSDKLKNKVALITGGDSGIGRAVAIAFAREGADVVFIYLDEHEDAAKTRKFAEESGRRCLAISGDIGEEAFCQSAVESVFKEFGRLDILINNAAEQHPQEDFLQLTSGQLERTFRTNLFSMFYLTKAALKYLPEGAAIVNTTSVTAYRGSPTLIDYSSTKGAIVAFTRSLSKYLAEKRIRVNAVAPGPIWTPLIPSTFPADRVKSFGADTPMKRPGEPAEVAPCFVFLASNDSSYMTGQVLHPNGGEIING